jgi:DNA repair protein RecO (recombination protein O)
VIIKKTKLGEADRILTMYTPRLGKIQGMAKGVRRPRSKLSGHLELLTHSLVTLARGKNIDTIIGSQTIRSFLPLKSDLERAACGLYAIELVDRFTPEHVEDPSVFNLLVETLEGLSISVHCRAVLRWFELQLLGRVGYRPQLDACVSCRRPVKTGGYFCPGAGGLLCPACQRRHSFSYPLSLEALGVMQSFQQNISVIPPLSNSVSDELERVLKGYIKYLLDRDVKSADWLETIKRVNSPS